MYHEKNYFLCSYFRHISLCFYSNFNQESPLDAELNSESNELSRSKFEKKTQGDMLKIRTKKVVFFMIPIPKFILKNRLRGAPFLNFKAF